MGTQVDSVRLFSISPFFCDDSLFPGFEGLWSRFVREYIEEKLLIWWIKHFKQPGSGRGEVQYKLRLATAARAAYTLEFVLFTLNLKRVWHQQALAFKRKRTIIHSWRDREHLLLASDRISRVSEEMRKCIYRTECGSGEIGHGRGHQESLLLFTACSPSL